MSIADRAGTLMYNAQSMAATSNSLLRGIIAKLEAMMGDSVTHIYASTFNADIPQFSADDLPNVMAEVKGYLEGVVSDAAAIEGAVTNNATKAIAKLQQLQASLVPADPTITLADHSIQTATGVIAAERAALETGRKQAESELLDKFAAMNFPAPPGVCLGALADIRLNAAETMGKIATQAIQLETEQNIKLFTERAQREFDITSQIVEAWAQLVNQTVRMIGQLIADYEQSPLLHAQVAADQSSALVGAYAGLNRATMQLVNAMGDSYKAELAPYKLEVLEDALQIDAYKASVDLTMAQKGSVASALASSLRNAGQVASACLGSISAHGSYVERTFS